MKAVRNIVFAFMLFLGVAWGKSYVIPVEGTIDQPLATFIDQSLSRAEREGASGVVFMVDTPGGRIDAALKISDRIIASTLPSLAVVKNAYSAGALISLSAQQIVMLPGSEIGAALPISVNPITNEPSAVDRKFISAFSAKFRTVAEARGRPGNIASAMVDPDIVIPNLKTKGDLLTLSAKKAVELKIADAQVGSLRAGLEKAGFNAETVEISTGPQIQAARFLTSPLIAALLIGIGILGIVLEFFIPGTTLPGIVGVAALALYFIGGFLAGSTGSLQLILFFAGVMLLLAELFFFPGSVLAGLAGAGLIIASVYLTFGDQALQVGAWSVVVLTAGLFIIFRFFPRTRLGRGLVLEGAVADVAQPRNELEALQGAIGTALTDLRPAGMAQFGDRRVDVVTAGEFIERGNPVRVAQVEGVRVVVRRDG